MKKAIFILLSAIMLTGCGRSAEDIAPLEIESRFKCVETQMHWEVLVDTETGVMYAVSTGLYNHGTFTLLVDKDGKPLIWKGEKIE